MNSTFIRLGLVAACVLVTNWFTHAADLVPTDSSRWGHSVPGKIGNCWTNGADGALGAALTNNAASLKLGSDEVKTYALWFKRSAGETILSCGGSSGDLGWFVPVSSSAINFWYSLNGTSFQSAWNTGFSVVTGQWHLLVVMINNVDNRIRISMDGEPYVERTFSGNIFTPVGPFAVGGRFSTSWGNSMYGLYDEHTVWDRELTQSEIEELWNDGDGIDLAALL